MAEYLTNTADLTAVADAIRAKGGTVAQLVYPSGFVSAIQAIQTGVTPQLIVTTSAGAAVTATKGSKTVSGTAGADGTCTLELSEAGEWSVTSSLNGNSKTQTVLIGTQTADIRLFDSVFANNSWETIIAVCKAGNVPDSWAVGNSKNMTIGGAEYQIDIIGKNHDDYADGSGKAPLTFQMHDCYATEYPMIGSSSTTKIPWKDTTMRMSTLPALLLTMPSEVQSGIREVSKITGIRDSSGNVTLDTTSDKLFLLSPTEMGITTDNVDGGDSEGTVYTYYVGMEGSSMMRDKVYWLRSRAKYETNHFQVVQNAYPPSKQKATELMGVRFAFCF